MTLKRKRQRWQNSISAISPMKDLLIFGVRLTKVWHAKLSLFVTGKMYARERIPHQTRQLITVAALTVLSRTEELKLHIYGALNVGCSPEQVAEVIFQCGIYGGMPVVNQALKVLREVLNEKGLWPLEAQV